MKNQNGWIAACTAAFPGAVHFWASGFLSVPHVSTIISCGIVAVFVVLAGHIISKSKNMNAQ